MLSLRTKRALLTSLVAIYCAACGVGFYLVWTVKQDVDRVSRQLMLDPGPRTTLVFDANDHPISALYREHRMPVLLEEMSANLVNAVLVTEDRRFYQHDGVDVRRMAASWFANLRAGHIVQGASTITQQFVRGAFLDRSRTYSRKIREAWLANRLESQFSKNEILQAYLNHVYLGEGYYGVEAASRGYFGKPAAELNPSEAATLAAMINRPSGYGLRKAGLRIRERRDWVLAQMHDARHLDDQAYHAAVALPVDTMLATADARRKNDPTFTTVGPYFVSTISEWLYQTYGVDRVLTGGLRVYTTLDSDVQRYAEDAVLTRLKALDKRHESAAPLQGALVAIEPATGNVRAMVGARDFTESPFNRATDARRQPGSAFKPFVFAAAIEAGMSPGSTIDGLTDAVPSSSGAYLPADHDRDADSMTLRSALVHSSNRAAVHLLALVGIRNAIDVANRFGLDRLPEVPSLALGTGEVSLLHLTSAYTAFANRGILQTPVMIRRIEDANGHVLYRGSTEGRRVMSEVTAFLMASMLADVVDHGTGYNARIQGFKLRAGGKTGTTDDHSDAWFVGFTPNLAAGIWMGFDRPHPIMRDGFAAVVAVPAWGRFMKDATTGAKSDWISSPSGVQAVRLCAESGLLATEYCELAGTARSELMAYGKHVEPCPIHTGAPTASRPADYVVQQQLPASSTASQPVVTQPGPMPAPLPPQIHLSESQSPPATPPPSMLQQAGEAKKRSFRCRVFGVGCQ
jgi:penicillin-binding protein 1A